MLRKFRSDQQGGIVLEASLVLPFFLAFVVGIILFIQLAVMEMALQAGVTEATKSIAGQLYPVRLLVQEAKSHYDQSRVSEMINSAVDRVKSARDKVVGAEDLADEYAAYIPDSLLELIKWEKEKRRQGEGEAQEEIDQFYDQTVKPRINAAFTPIAYAFCDSATIRKDQFKVISVTLPSMERSGNAFFGIEAQIEYKFPLPFISKMIILKKKAFERAWVGA
ncbi:TadE/TadG family type IV pilus assembly protein [Paenibacillus sp. GCM10027628]|uniref:TadE/TadG family type IV pilus assembly protein n=1 Tax=Paenibacillus sp. GCM10027628 TaxID=3273413 RepID=UPI00362A4262